MSAPKLTSNEQEAANRAEATALLIRAGYRVYRPEADCYGEDMIVRAPDGELRAVQLKGRPTVDLKRYGQALNIWMLFPDPASDEQKRPKMNRPWFLVPHSKLFDWIKARHGQSAGWSDGWSYPHISKELRSFLTQYQIAPGGTSNVPSQTKD